MTDHRYSPRRIVSVVALAACLGAVGAPMVVADEPGDDTQVTAPVDATLEGIVTITALVNDDVGTSPVPGVVFALYPVTGYDLSTPEGWQAARELVANPDDLDESLLGEPIVLPATGRDGSVRTEEVPVGLYLLSQDVADPDAAAYENMLFTLPSPDEDSEGGLSYSLLLYPKPHLESDPPDIPIEPPTPIDPTEPPTEDPTEPPTEDPTEPVMPTPIEPTDAPTVPPTDPPGDDPEIPTGGFLDSGRDWLLMGSGLALVGTGGYLLTRRRDEGAHEA